ncbi:hypothetical protein [Thermicanus aegyptius]|uniref:hypothetical protein n=1 Tax=Thermicanus aegyptius TaxID=94009 RepID=UPI0004018B2F|nr:hypothetical protein [Thermicanus aegyptius]
MYGNERETKAFNWKIGTKINGEILVFEGEGMGRVIVLVGMKVAAQILFVGDVVKVSTTEGYSAQILFQDRIISIVKEE